MSSLKVDNITGRGSTGFTGSVKSEGGNTTTDLQQGLAKAWAKTSGDGTPAIDDSFNNASLTDYAVGDQIFAFTNIMSNSNYCCNTSVSETGFVICIQVTGQATSNAHIKSHDVASTTGADSDGKSYSNNGDLA